MLRARRHAKATRRMYGRLFFEKNFAVRFDLVLANSWRRAELNITMSPLRSQFPPRAHLRWRGTVAK
jgi:hypothetical protein